MDISSLGIAGVVAITAVSYLVGLIAKTSKLNNKWIPSVCGVVGLVLGIVAMHVMPGFPAEDYITAAAVGVASGLAATGVNELVKKLKTTNKKGDA